MKLTKWVVALAALFFMSALFAQPRLVNRAEEKEEFPDLQTTEANQEKNIQDAYQRLRAMGFLVRMTEIDRATKFKEEEDPLNFDYTFRYVEYTPRNTYIRFVVNDQEFLLNTFGAHQEVKALMDERIGKAKEIGAWNQEGSKDPSFGGDKKGVELTQYAFIYSNDRDGVRRVVGSRRKSVTLFFDGAEGELKQGELLTLHSVLTRIVEDNFREGVTNTQLIVDPSPNTQAMDDLVILHRYNQKPTKVTVLGMMSNTATNPHRKRFKQKFYVKLMDHFFRLYRMVANYASKGDNDYNEEVIELLEESLDY